MTETICITCGNEFDEFSGDVHKRVCMTCILLEEDPEVIQPLKVKVPDIHRRGYIIEKKKKTQAKPIQPQIDFIKVDLLKVIDNLELLEQKIINLNFKLNSNLKDK